MDRWTGDCDRIPSWPDPGSTAEVLSIHGKAIAETSKYCLTLATSMKFEAMMGLLQVSRDANIHVPIARITNYTREVSEMSPMLGSIPCRARDV